MVADPKSAGLGAAGNGVGAHLDLPPSPNSVTVKERGGNYDEQQLRELIRGGKYEEQRDSSS